MGGFTFDIARGREVELYNRVNTNDPANSALKLVVLAASGLEHDSILRTYATLADILAAANNEVTNPGYSRKTFTDATLDDYTVDTDTHAITLPLTPQTFIAISPGDVWSKALICYDGDTTSGTDADIIPITAQDVRLNNAAVPPDGGNIVFSWPTGLLVA